MNTTGEFRKELSKCFELSREGKLSGDALRGVIGCANQINKSMAVELRGRAQLMREGEAMTSMGNMKIFTK